MMRSSLVTAIVLAGTPALADPVTTPAPCSVDVVRAPDDARKIVEAWLATTRRCSVSLEVRIVETKGGLYVIARDDRGAVRDRVVPDAQTAGALIASWADDGQPAPIATVDVHTEIQLVPVPLPSREPPSLEPIVDPAGGPGALAATPLRDDGEAHARTRPHHWIGEFLVFGGGKSSFRALRGEADVLHGSTWTAGVALQIGGEQREASNDMATETQDTSDLSGTIYIARPFRAGGWELRPAAGVGVMYTRVFDDASGFVGPGMLPSFTGYDRVSPFAEGSVIASHAIVGNLAVSAGALVTAYGQRFDALLPELQHRDFEAMFIAGLRFGFL